VIRAVNHPKIDVRTDEGTLEGESGFGLIGPFLDWYPNPSAGFHVVFALGVARGYLELETPLEEVRTDGAGFGASLGAGHEWFLSNDFSLGAMVQADYVQITLKGENPVPDSKTWQTWSPTLLAAGTFH
jgi:hypothetical protein